MTDSDDLTDLDAEERALVRDGRRRAFVAAAWGTFLAVAWAMMSFWSWVFHEVPIWDWWLSR